MKYPSKNPEAWSSGTQRVADKTFRRALAGGLWSVAVFLFSACDGDRGLADDSFRSDQSDVAQACVLESPMLHYGQNHRPAALQPLPQPAAGGQADPADARCGSNDRFRFGAGIRDITGPAGGKIHMGNESPSNYSAGIQLRQFARSFVIASPCNGKRIALVLTDTGMMFESVRQAVLDEIALDPTLGALYGPDNLMLSATHTHSGPGGYAHYTAFNFFRFGFDEQNFQVIVQGIVAAIRDAHAEFDSNPTLGSIDLAMGELLGANVSRAPEAYLSNPQQEREAYRDEEGGEVDTNRLMTLLRLQRDDGFEVGSLNWFSVHPTSDAHVSQGAVPISSENKGYAMYLWERMQGGHDPADAARAPFVASFQQGDEGDVYSILWHRDDEEEARRDAQLMQDAHQDEPFALTVANGTAQLAKALELYARADESLIGAVDYRLSFVKMDELEVTDPVVLESLRHPAELDAEPKRTCTAAMGFSFPAGGGGDPPGAAAGFTQQGISCRDLELVDAVQSDLLAVLEGRVPPETLAYAVGCNFDEIPGLNLQCQAEKPVLLVFGPPVEASANIVPMQIFRIGNLAIIGLPWEINTMAGRRIRDTVLQVLKDVGVDYAVINGLSNDYVSYLTTREEYAVQRYEGASNQFGPWTLAAVQQELRKLAISLRDDQPAPSGPTPPRTSPANPQPFPPQVADSVPPGGRVGHLLDDVESNYVPGDTVRASFQTANPNNHLMTDRSFLWVERQAADGNWQVIARDRDPETTFNWISESPEPQFMPSPYSVAEMVWRIPRNAVAGTYRLRHTGFSRDLSVLEPEAFEGISSPFEIVGQAQACP